MADDKLFSKYSEKEVELITDIAKLDKKVLLNSVNYDLGDILKQRLNYYFEKTFFSQTYSDELLNNIKFNKSAKESLEYFELEQNQHKLIDKPVLNENKKQKYFDSYIEKTKSTLLTQV